MRPLQIILGLLLVGLMVAVELLLMSAHSDRRNASERFKGSSLTITNLANVQRETLRLDAETHGVVAGETDMKQLELQRQLLDRQLQVAEAWDVPQAELHAVEAALDRFDTFARYLFRGGTAQDRSQVLEKLEQSADDLELRVKELYDKHEQKFLRGLSQELESGARSQRALLVLGLVVLVIAITLALLIRRSVRADFQRAYDALVHEVQERKTLQEQLSYQAFHDILTGLANRSLFIERVEEAVARIQESGETMAVIFIDLDDFKSVNDTLGLEAGDSLLKEAARRLDLCLRGEDTAARLGGDEFAVLVEHSSDVERVAERILEAFQPPIRVAGHDVLVPASLGIAVGGPEVEFASTILANADIAMYAAKSRGKGQYAIFAPGMQQDAETRMRLKGDMQQSLEAGQFTVHYQPIMRLSDGSCSGAEALVRWNHPEFGLVSPASFIPVAEDSGFIYELGLFVLDEATKKAAGWQQQLDSMLSISVNVSARQLQHPDIVSDVKAALDRSRLRPELLVLEITESVLMVNRDVVATKLRELKELGVGIAIDDFGTGYSSLSYLQELPVDTIKVDKSFIDGVDAGSEESALARAVIKLGSTLSLKIVAEGIETAGSREMLTSLGCDYGQGYLFSRPMDGAAIDRFLATGEVSVGSAA
ncbi:MAG TPA: EAL domain-containing protein [Actinomycetota bacterium]|nr:EAL domain-containing protein [Actinomycetota bacterium]